MKRSTIILTAATLLTGIMPARAALSLDSCKSLARANYPLLAEYGILDNTTEISLSDINKGWLPRISAYGQATIQNEVPSFPSVLTDMLAKMGQDFQGLSRFQPRVGLELNQTIWDGGAAKAGRERIRAQQQVKRASLDVDMYALDARVESVYFGCLLLDEQIEQTNANIALLDRNIEKLATMVTYGTATPADRDLLIAQRITTIQSLTEAEGARESYMQVLGIYTGRDLMGETLEKPDADMPSDFTSDRPELKLLERRTELNEVELRAQKISSMPKIGLFAQAYYGYPGYDYFSAMRTRDWSFNALAGVKLEWNISSFYTRGNERKRSELTAAEIATQRNEFLFNSDITVRSQRNRIGTLRKVAAEDSANIRLRESVRQAAETQLDNGVIDITALLSRITEENIARLQARYHEIQLLQEIYKLKNTLNR